MKKSLYFLVLDIGMIILSGCAKDAEVLTGTIAGFVTDYTNANAPIAGASVTLNTKGLTKTTGSDGRFEFSGLEPGTYSLSANANEYQPTTKQVTVWAGQTANCDFQLETGRVDVEFSIVNIIFAKDAEQASFSIKNNSNKQLSFSVTNYPDFIQVSPTTGSVAAKGTQAVSVKIINRKSITETKNGQMTVNIGNDSYIVNFSVEAYQEEKVIVDINPQSLTFDSNTEQLTFTMVSGNSFDSNFTLTSNLDLLTLSQNSGTLLAKGQIEISVTVNNRKEVNTTHNGQITVNIGGNSYIVSVHIDKYEDPNSQNTPATDVTRGLQAYYKFDNSTAEDAQGAYNGFLNGGSFIEDTPNGKGKAVSLKKSDFISIANNPLSATKNSTINIWIKDFGQGNIVGSSPDGSTPNWTPSLAMSNNTYLMFATRGHFEKFNTNVSNYMSGKWTMLTLVVKNNGANSAEYTLYINGQLAATVLEGFREYECPMLTIGGSTYQDDVDSYPYGGFMADPMKVDNLRLYNVALTDEEIHTIYEAER